MARLILIFGFIFSQATLASLTSANALQPGNKLIQLPGVELIEDHAHTTYELFEPQKNPQLKTLINSVLYNIITNSTVGRGILTQILHCNSEAIYYHIGIDKALADKAALECSSWSSANNTQLYIFNSPIKSIRKLSDDSSARKYALINTSSQNWSYDSWTDTKKNQTYLIISDLKNFRKKSLELLLYLQLSHELAVYFDAKFWVGSIDWMKLPYMKGASFSKDSDLAVFTAANNPLINLTFTYIRAFKVEHKIITDLAKGGVVPFSLLEVYNPLDYPFLYPALCDSACIQQVVEDQAQSWLKFALPMIAFSPQYRGRKAAAYAKADKEDHDNIIQLLQTFAGNFANETEEPFLSLVDPHHIKGFEKKAKELSILMETELLPDDMSVFKSNDLILDSGKKQINLMLFMSNPLLSGINTKFSSGPRPRIRVGLKAGDIDEYQ